LYPALIFYEKREKIMTNKFPHLQNATGFPGDNERVYSQYPNSFDYTRWTSKTTLKPCTVRWTADDANRVKWDTDIERDAWFDRLTADTFELDSGLNVIPGESVRLPIPYQAMQYANYLVVSIPDMPGDGEQLDYSTSHVSRLYYFVVDTRQINATVTECVLELDYWTTYINSVDIPRIMVEQGHVAQAYETVETYLDDPIHNNRGLTAPEPDAPAAPVMTASNRFIPLATGEMWLLLAVKCTYTQFTGLTPVGDTLPDTPPVYADTGDYWGYQYQVTGYAWGGVPNLNDVSAPNATGISANNTRPNGYTIIGLKTADAYAHDFFGQLTARLPQAYNLIEACYVVPRNMINPTSGAKLLGFDIYRINPAATGLLADIDLQPSAFGYPSEYARLAKLYTAPYAWLSITDENNNESVIRVEDTTSNLAVMRRVSLAYPYLSAQTFLTGVSGNGKTEYTWADLTNTPHTTDMPDSAYHALSSHAIPLYTLMIDNAVKYVNDNDSTNRVQARENALNAYHTSVRGTNTGNVNANANAETNLANTQASTANSVANTKLQTDTATNNTNLSNTANTDITGLNNNKLDADVVTSNFKLGADKSVDKLVTTAAYEANVDSAVLSNVSSAVNTIAGAAISLAAAPATAGGSLAAGAAVAGAGMSVGLSGYNTSVTLSNKEAVYNANLEAMDSKANNAITTNRTLTTRAMTLATDVTNRSNTLNTALTNANNKLATGVTANNANTGNANAARSRGTAVANNQRQRDAGIFGAQTALEQAQDVYAAKLRDLHRAAPVTIAASQGDALPDIWGTRGLQVRVMTQSPDVIRRCGDAFLQYGYTLRQNVENPTLLVKSKFTYWRGDALIYAISAPARAVNIIRNMFEAGVTVWRDPDTIGSSIYNN
jgi:hypothetical protein